jgi:DNA polymerase-3 subunit gamma/tau
VLVKELRRIGDSEGYESDELALTTVARRAAGSVRDALSLLEQVAALGERHVTVEGVNKALGLAESDAFSRLASAIVERDAKGALELVAALSSQGVDLRRFVSEAIASFRGVFLAHYAPNLAEVADEPESILETWRALAKILPAAEVLRAVDQLGEALVRLREGREERLMIELTLLRLTRPETSLDVESVGVRLDKVEQTLRRIARESQGSPEPRAAKTPVRTSPPPQAPSVEKPERTIPEPEATEELPSEAPVQTKESVQTDEPAALPELDSLTLDEFEAVWPALVGSVRDELGPRRLAMFREASPGHVEGSTVVLAIPEHLAFHLAQINDDPAIARIVGERASELLGGSIRIAFRSAAAPAEEADKARAPDKHELEEGSAATDPTALVEGLLGGQVIDDLP